MMKVWNSAYIQNVQIIAELSKEMQQQTLH